MSLFGFNKKEAPKPQDQDLFNNTSNLPTQQVSQLMQQGYNNDQIVQMLQGQGFNLTDIYDAISQAAIAPQQQQMQQPVQDPYAQPDPYAGQQQQQDMPFMEQQQYQQKETDNERIEEVAEAIIDEKWNALVKDINKVIEWKERTEARIVKMEQEIKGLKEGFDALHKGVLGKISEYDKNLMDVGSEIKAMEKVFQKILPTFTENVNKLSRIAGNIKK